MLLRDLLLCYILSCPVCGNVSKIVDSFYLAYFLLLLSVLLVAYYKIWDILFTYSLKFLSSLYLSSASQLNFGCFIMGLPSLDPTFCIPSAPAAIACIVTLAASATACAITSFVFD